MDADGKGDGEANRRRYVVRCRPRSLNSHPAAECQGNQPHLWRSTTSREMRSREHHFEASHSHRCAVWVNGKVWPSS